MTLYFADLGYLDGKYLADAYLAGGVMGSLGWQATGQITDDRPKGWQATGQITDDRPKGWQSNAVLTVEKAKAWQSTGIITDDKTKGWQSTGQITDDRPKGWQATGQITDDRPKGWQAEAFILGEKAKAWQATGQITDDRAKGWQATGQITDDRPKAWQATSVRSKNFGWQATAVLYNITQLRVLYQFPSRGLTGTNWIASSTQPTGHFSANNLNTDIVEEVWRGANGVYSVNLDCDTQVSQGIFLDTFALLNHNLTTTANVVLIGSNNPSHSPAGVSIPLLVTRDNLFYIAPDLPFKSWRYWRIAIDDPTNPANYLQAGVCVFGPSEIFVRSMTQFISFKRQNYKDTVITEGYSSVSNDRGIKKKVRFDFRNMNYLKTDYRKLSAIFEEIRTVRKALWIPTPEFPTRFAVFAKLVDIPEEQHNVISDEGDYVTLTLELDESL